MPQLYSKGSLADGVIITGVGKVSPPAFDARKMIGDLPRFRRMDAFTRYAVAAAREALRDADLSVPSEAGIVMASHFGPFRSTEKFLKGIVEHGAHLASAFDFPNTVMNMVTGMLSISFGVKGPGVTLAGGLEQAVNLAGGFIRRGRAPAMLAGFVEEKNNYFPVGEEGAVVYILENVEHAQARGIELKGSGKRELK